MDEKKMTKKRLSRMGWKRVQISSNTILDILHIVQVADQNARSSTTSEKTPHVPKREI